MTLEMVQEREAGTCQKGITRATRDEQVVSMWLHGRPEKTVKEYARSIQEFFSFVQKGIAHVTLEDVQSFQDSLEAQGLSSQRAKLSAIKSLFSFTVKVGYLLLNATAPVKLPKAKDTLAERIMPERDVIRMLALEDNPRNKALLVILYCGGLRNSEASGLCWKDIRETEEGSVLTVYGKGGKTRVVPLSITQWEAVKTVREDSGDDEPVFRSRKGGHLDQSAINRAVKSSAKKAGLDKIPSPHWLRHAHASHALDRNCPVHVLQQTVGHSSLAVTSRYTHVQAGTGSGKYLAI
jgi:integrase/recombinase XerD